MPELSPSVQFSVCIKVAVSFVNICLFSYVKVLFTFINIPVSLVARVVGNSGSYPRTILPSFQRDEGCHEGSVSELTCHTQGHFWKSLLFCRVLREPTYFILKLYRGYTTFLGISYLRMSDDTVDFQQLCSDGFQWLQKNKTKKKRLRDHIIC